MLSENGTENEERKKCHTIMEMLGIYANMMVDFSERVHKVHENRLSSDGEKCKDYVARNRTKKFTLSELAENVGKTQVICLINSPGKRA